MFLLPKKVLKTQSYVVENCPRPRKKKKKNKKRENFRVPPGGNPDLLFNENNFSRRG